MFIVWNAVPFAPFDALVVVVFFIGLDSVGRFAVNESNRVDDILDLLLAENGVHFFDAVNEMQLVQRSGTKYGTN